MHRFHLHQFGQTGFGITLAAANILNLFEHLFNFFHQRTLVRQVHLAHQTKFVAKFLHGIDTREIIQIDFSGLNQDIQILLFAVFHKHIGSAGPEFQISRSFRSFFLDFDFSFAVISINRAVFITTTIIAEHCQQIFTVLLADTIKLSLNLCRIHRCNLSRIFHIGRIMRSFSRHINQLSSFFGRRFTIIHPIMSGSKQSTESKTEC